MTNYFSDLNKINVSDKIEKKGKLSYLSWAYAWGELKKIDPTANYKIYENKDGWNYFTDGKTCWVKVGVMTKADEVGALEHIEYLPVMDNNNKSIPLDKVTSFDVNKAIQRALTKAIARHGLGLYIYAGEDLPDAEGENQSPTDAQIVRLQELGGSIQIVATYFKKRSDEVTAAEVQQMIDAKEKAIAKKGERKNDGAAQ